MTAAGRRSNPSHTAPPRHRATAPQALTPPAITPSSRDPAPPPPPPTPTADYVRWGGRRGAGAGAGKRLGCGNSAGRPVPRPALCCGCCGFLCCACLRLGVLRLMRRCIAGGGCVPQTRCSVLRSSCSALRQNTLHVRILLQHVLQLAAACCVAAWCAARCRHCCVRLQLIAG